MREVWMRLGRRGVAAMLGMAALVTVGTGRMEPPAGGGEEPRAEAARSMAEFKPSQHGFHFTNAFSGSPLPKGLEALGNLVGAPSRYGLCGGMSFSAADYFLAGKTIPETAAIPGHGTPLYDYIYRRQVESYDGLAAPAVFAEWMRRADRGPMGNQAATLRGLPAVVADLRAGKPVVLGLVLAKAGEPLWENHQVLAFGVECPSARETIIRIYDPNHPGNDEVRIRCRLTVAGELDVPGALQVGLPVMGVECRLEAAAYRERPARTKLVRGLFSMPYEAAVPPDGL